MQFILSGESENRAEMIISNAGNIFSFIFVESQLRIANIAQLCMIGIVHTHTETLHGQTWTEFKRKSTGAFKTIAMN